MAGKRSVLSLLDEGGGLCRRFSGQELAGLAGLWSSRFTTAGLGPGHRVLLCPARDAQLITLHLGALSAGLTVVPLNPALSLVETERMVASCRPSLAVVSQDWAGAHAELMTELPCWTVEEPGAGDRPALEAGSDDKDPAALLIFTSGTTGQPKGVALSDANLLYDLETLMELWGIGPADRLLHMLPAHHFHGLVLALYGTLMSGAELLLAPGFDASAALRARAEHKATVIMGVPTMYGRMLEAATSADDLCGLRLALCGSAPLPLPLWQAFRERFGLGLVERYGLTECGIVTSNLPHAPVPGSVGRVLPGTTIAIRHGNDYHLAHTPTARQSGEVCMAGPSVMSGYAGDERATAEMIHDGYMHSGDLGRFDENGNLFIDGRIKDLIIVGGTNVVPGEVEAALSGVEGIVELAVAGRPDKDLGETVVAHVVAAAGIDCQALERALRARATKDLAAYKRPHHYTFTDKLPRNEMGKLDRASLAARN